MGAARTCRIIRAIMGVPRTFRVNGAILWELLALLECTVRFTGVARTWVAQCVEEEVPSILTSNGGRIR
jgi:hypothetical protein